LEKLALRLVVEELDLKLADGEMVEEGIVVGASVGRSVRLKGLPVVDEVLEGETLLLGGCAALILAVLL
jgi:hypothetical protein